jgi:tetratricopeptide (TPR) repeat protein
MATTAAAAAAAPRALLSARQATPDFSSSSSSQQAAVAGENNSSLQQQGGLTKQQPQQQPQPQPQADHSKKNSNGGVSISMSAKKNYYLNRIRPPSSTSMHGRGIIRDYEPNNKAAAAAAASTSAGGGGAVVVMEKNEEEEEEQQPVPNQNEWSMAAVAVHHDNQAPPAANQQQPGGDQHNRHHSRSSSMHTTNSNFSYITAFSIDGKQVVLDNNSRNVTTTSVSSTAAAAAAAAAAMEEPEQPQPQPHDDERRLVVVMEQPPETTKMINMGADYDSAPPESGGGDEQYAMVLRSMSPSPSSPSLKTDDDDDYFLHAQRRGMSSINFSDENAPTSLLQNSSQQQQQRRRRRMLESDPSGPAAAAEEEGEEEESPLYFQRHPPDRPQHQHHPDKQQDDESSSRRTHATVYSSAVDIRNNNNDNCDSNKDLQRAMELSQQAGYYLKRDAYDTALQLYARALQLYHVHEEKHVATAAVATATTAPLLLLTQGDHCDIASAAETTTSSTSITAPPPPTTTTTTLAAAAAAAASSTRVICLCNAAGCLRNMGSIHKRTKNYEEALSCWNQALDFYKQSRIFVMAALEKEQALQQQQQLQSVLALTTPAAVPQSSSRNNDYVCLDAYIVETLQSRGNLFVKRDQQYYEQAIACHEEAVDLLLELDRLRTEEDSSNNNNDDDDKNEESLNNENSNSNNSSGSGNAGFWTVDMSGVVFCAMEKERLIEHLTLSLESLGNLYKTTASYQDAVSVWEEALGMLRRRHEEQQLQHQQQQQQQLALVPHGSSVTSPPPLPSRTSARASTKQRMVKILRSLSELYMDRNELELAVAPLNEAMDLIHFDDDHDDHDDSDHDNAASAAELLCLAMDRLGQAFEQQQQQHQSPSSQQEEEESERLEEQGNYEIALACYEKALLARNRFLGDGHIEVAKSLVDVGRVMEKQGNTEGSLDLYRAAQAIYAKQVTSDQYMVASEDVGTILQLIPSLFEQRRYEEAVAYLNKCLEAEEVADHHHDPHGRNSINSTSSGGKDVNSADVGKSAISPRDRTQIYFDLGRAYMGLSDYVSATVCLVECAKQLTGDDAEEDDETRANICAMLELVERLQREERSSSHRGGSIHSDDYSYDSEHTAGYDDDYDDDDEHVDDPSLASGDEASAEESSQSSGSETPSRRQQQQQKNADNAAATTSLVASIERATSLTPVTADFSKSASRSEHNSGAGDGDSDNHNNNSISSPEEGGEGDPYGQLHHATSLTDTSFQVESQATSYVAAAAAAVLDRQNGGIGNASAGELQTSDELAQQEEQRQPRHHHDEVHHSSSKASNNMEPSDLSTSILSADLLNSSMLDSSLPEHDLHANGKMARPTPPPAAGAPRRGSRIAGQYHEKGNGGNLHVPSRSAIVAVNRARIRPEALDSTPALVDSATTDDDTETASLLRPEGGKRFGFGLSLNLHTPRKKKGQALENLAGSISGHHHQQQHQAQKAPTSTTSAKRSGNPFGSRRRRAGFESLSDDKQGPVAQHPDVANSSSVLPSPDLQRDEEYHLDDSSFDGPIRHIEAVHETADDAISQITLVLDDRTAEKPVGRSNEWWWGVTAEGFGRWFPSSFVSQAVEVADGFLSAKAIHAKVKSAPLDVASDDESNSDEVAMNGDHAPRSTHQGESLAVATTATMKDRHSQRQLRTRSFSEEGSLPLNASSNLDQMLNVSAPLPRRRSEVEIQSELIQCGQTIANMRKTLGATDPQLGTSLFRLAVLHSRVRNISAAIEAGNEALQIQKANGDLEHAARSSHFIAEMFVHEKQYKPALTHYSDALRMEHSVYGRYSENSAKTLNCIGMVRSLCNEFKQAMDSHKEALSVLKECHGDKLEGNPLVSQTLCQIGAVYYRERNSLSTIKSKRDDYTTFIEAGMLEVIGRAHEERGSYRMAIAFFEEKLQFSENHKQEDAKSSSSIVATEELATTLNSLGMLSSRAGLFMEALDYYDRALQVQNKIGCDPVYTATSQVLTATVQNQLGHWVKALKLLEDALVVLKRELGTEHETVAATLYHIGVVQASLCNFDIAMVDLKDAYNIQKALLGKDHPAALRTRREIGNILVFFNPEQLDTAFEYFTDVLAAQQRIHGFKHPNIAETLHSIGCAYIRKGDHATALKTLEECYYMRLEFLGVDHPLQATTLHEIAKIHICRGRYKKATKICDTVLDIRKESLSESHIDYARALGTKGNSLTLRGDVNSAMACLNEALHIAKQAVFTTYPVVTTHPSVAEINVHIATLHLRNCQFADAKASVQAAIDSFNQAGKLQQRPQQQHSQHPTLQEAISLLERIERDEMLCV